MLSWHLKSLISLSVVMLIVILAPLPAQAQEPQNNFNVFLPVIAKSDSTPPQPAPPVSGALFVDTHWKTASNSIAVDGAGGMHLAYYYYESANGQSPTSAVYLYCPSQCQQPTNWNGVMMGEVVNQVQQN